MGTLSRFLDALFLTAVGYAAIVAAVGVDVRIGSLAISSRKLIVPGMIVWLLAILSGLVHWRRGDQPPIEREAHTGGLAFSHAFGLAVLLVALAVHRAVGRPFFMDDLMMVDFARKLDAAGVQKIFRGDGWSTTGFIRPVPELLWWLEVQLHGCTPVLCELTNLGIHLLNVALVGVVARLVVPARHLAGWAMLLFAVCGTHAEPLLWVSSRYDLLATLFGLTSVAAYLRWFDGGRTRWLVVLLTSLTLALFSKEAALGLPIGLAGVAFVREPEDGSKRTFAARLGKASVPLLLLLAGIGYRALVIPPDLARSQRRWIEIAKLLQMPVSPLAPLTYPVNTEQIVELALPARLLVAAMLSLVPLMAARRVARGPDRATLLVCGLLLAATAPVHNVINLAATLKQSRYLYLPAALYAVLVVELARALPERRAAVVLALVVTANTALLRLNAEPFVASGAVVARVLEGADGIVAALKTGASVEMRGLPLQFRGAPTCWGYTIVMPLAERAGVPISRVFVQGDGWREVPPRYDRAFRFTLDRGFVEEAP